MKPQDKEMFEENKAVLKSTLERSIKIAEETLEKKLICKRDIAKFRANLQKMKDRLKSYN